MVGYLIQYHGNQEQYYTRGMQWMQLKTFYYNQHMKPYQKDDFVKVQSELNIILCTSVLACSLHNTIALSIPKL